MEPGKSIYEQTGYANTQPSETLGTCRVQQPVMQELYDISMSVRSNKEAAGSILMKLQGLKSDEENVKSHNELSIRDMLESIKAEISTTRDTLNTLSELLVK